MILILKDVVLISYIMAERELNSGYDFFQSCQSYTLP